jgi:alpha-beta hydrolase superfamily lysophospholipase
MRGRGSFDPDRLRATLAPFDPSVPADAHALGEYYAFYGLDCRDVSGEVRHHIGTLPSGEHTLVVQRFVPAAPAGTAVVCHGYYDHVGLYGHLIRYLLGRNLAVLTFDQPGHGLSSGARATIDSFASYVRALRDVLEHGSSGLPRPWHLIGQSMGGAIVMEHLATADGREFSEAVLFAPLVRPALWPVNRVVYEIARRTITERPRTITQNAENPEFLALMRADPLQPDVLPVQWVTAMVAWMRDFERHPRLPLDPKIIQGHADRTVGWRYNLKLIRSKCEPRVLEIPGARHHLVNESEVIREQMWSWLDGACGWGPRTTPAS